MSLDVQPRDHQGWISIAGVDVKRVFRETSLRHGNILVPTQFFVLPDFRPASDAALAQALEGLAPGMGGLSEFDPALGPFSSDSVKSTPWAQSLDFMRDIKSAQIGQTKLAPAWIKGWLNCQATENGQPIALFAPHQLANTKTDRLIWRSRRILNCLAHVLPMLEEFDDHARSAFWNALLHDVAKVGAPTDTLWNSLKDGFSPLSQRAVWLRAVALLGVEASLPSLLRTDLVDKSINDVKASIQSDGLMQGGSIIGTLSAGADLCMLGRIPAIEGVLNQIRHALVTLRHKDGTLVTFGAGASEYSQLLNGVIGPGSLKPATLLLESGVVRLCAQGTVVWLRTPQSNHACGAVFEIEADSGALISSYSSGQSAVGLSVPVHVSQARCKRRDEQDFHIIEASATLTLGGRNYTSLRQIRVSKDGSRIDGEDILKPEGPKQDAIVKEICFAIPSACAYYLSKDEQSAVIVTSGQQAWRFRAEGMDISFKIGSDSNQRTMVPTKRYIMVCRASDMQRRSDFRATWQFVLEDLE
jgi:hypothetical protein